MSPRCLLLLPAPLERFILSETVEDLLRAPDVVAAGPPRVPYGAVARLPEAAARPVAARQARELDPGGSLAVVVVFHPLQLPLAEALLDRHPAAVLWYARWDRYEEAPDAGGRMRRRLAGLHERAVARAEWVWAVSDALAEVDRAHGREVDVVVPAHDSFPSPIPEGPAAVSLGHFGRRTDWRLLRALVELMPDLIVLLVGERHDDEAAGDRDFARCLELPGLVWLGRLDDDAAARIIARADIGLLPFRWDAFNDVALPQRIIKHARVGRRTLVPDLAGVRTLGHAVIVCRTLDDWKRELRSAQGAPFDHELSEWATAQTAARQNVPLWNRLARLGIEPRRDS